MIPVGVPLTAVVVSDERLALVCSAGKNGVCDLWIMALSVLETIEQPVTIGVFSGIVMVVRIQAVGQLPDIGHAIEIPVVEVIEIGIQGVPSLILLAVAKAVAIQIAAVIFKVSRIEPIHLLDTVWDATAVCITKIGADFKKVGSAVTVRVGAGGTEDAAET